MEIEKIKINSSKGNLSVAIHYPETKTDRLAILCPGYLDSKDYKHLIALAEALNKKGYTAVRFDPTGTWESEGDISDYTTTQYLEDTKNVLGYMLKQANYKHILLGGHSRGGQLSILYAARDPRISIVLGIMPSSERTNSGRKFEASKKIGFRISQRDLPDNINEKREYKVPYSHVEDLNKYHVLKEIKKIKAPVILIAGESDDMVLLDEVKEIFDNANEPKKFVIIPKIGHDYRHRDGEVKIVNEKILEQLNSIKL